MEDESWVDKFRMFFQSFTVMGRIRLFVEKLESEIDGTPECYEKARSEFSKAMKEYISINFMYIIVSLVFYASIVSSVTATLGFEVNIFREVYSIFGFTTAGIVYFITMYLRRVARVDVENSRARLVSCMYGCSGHD